MLHRRVCFITFINHHRSQLPVTEGLLAALIVTTKQRPLRNAQRARYEGSPFHFFLLRTLLPLLHNPAFPLIPPKSHSFTDI